MAKLVKLERFFENPERSSFRLSPNGQRVAWLSNWKNRLNLYVSKLNSVGTAKEEQQLTHSDDEDIRGFFWARENHIVFAKDRKGREAVHLFGVSVEDKTITNYTPYPGTHCRLIDKLPEDPEHIVFSMNHRNKQIFDLYRLNLNSGAISLIEENPGGIASWLTSTDGNVHIARFTNHVDSGILYRKSADTPWEILFETHFKNSIVPLHFDPARNILVVGDNLESDTIAIREYNIISRQFVQTLFHEPDFDITGIIRCPRNKRIIGYKFSGHRPEVKYSDNLYKKVVENIRGIDPLPHYRVTSVSRDENRFLLKTYSDTSLGKHFLYDASSNQTNQLSDSSPWTKEQPLPPMQQITFKARDDMTITGYLTLPHKSSNPSPLLVIPHGGPSIRDHWGYDPETQFFANRGYAVLQVNYRGSTGFGKQFWTAGFKQWGLQMLDDIVDGVSWTIQQGYVDPRRVGIMGASYGGYLALMATIRYGENFKCAISCCGITNILTFLDTLPKNWLPYLEMIYETTGHPIDDKAQLVETSPELQADLIQAPIFLAHGKNDPRVSYLESERIYEKLRTNGIQVDYLLKTDEGHGFRKQENRFDFYRRVESFLQTHLRS